MYSVFETAEFADSLQKLNSKDSAFVAKKLQEYIYPQLRQEPHFGPNIKKLKNYNPETWRYRIGRYRVFYGIDENDTVVLLLTIEQRKDAYR
jgi:mRNA interferase RelE/StbE